MTTDPSRTKKNKHRSFSIGLPRWLSVPIIKIDEEITTSTERRQPKLISISFGTDKAPYIAHNDLTPTCISSFYYDPSMMELSKITATVSRAINSTNQVSSGFISLLRSDTLESIAELSVSTDAFQIIETQQISNLPSTPMPIEIVIRVESPKTNLQVYSLSLYV